MFRMSLKKNKRFKISCILYRLMDGKHGEMDNFTWHMSSSSQHLSASAVPAMKGVVTKSKKQTNKKLPRKL